MLGCPTKMFVCTSTQTQSQIFIRGPVLTPAGSSSLMHANHSLLRGFWMLGDTALERAEAELSNAVSTSAWKSDNGERLACKSVLESAGLSTGPLTYASAMNTSLIGGLGS